MSAVYQLISLLSVILLVHASFLILNENYWWMYAPAYGLSGLVCLVPLPSSNIWRLLSSISALGGGLLMIFLIWTFHGLAEVPGTQLEEAKNIFPVAVGVALTTLLRILVDPINRPIHYIRTLILLSLLLSSIITSGVSIGYYL